MGPPDWVVGICPKQPEICHAFVLPVSLAGCFIQHQIEAHVECTIVKIDEEMRSFPTASTQLYSSSIVKLEKSNWLPTKCLKKQRPLIPFDPCGLVK